NSAGGSLANPASHSAASSSSVERARNSCGLQIFCHPGHCLIRRQGSEEGGCFLRQSEHPAAHNRKSDSRNRDAVSRTKPEPGSVPHCEVTLRSVAAPKRYFSRLPAYN